MFTKTITHRARLAHTFKNISPFQVGKTSLEPDFPPFVYWRSFVIIFCMCPVVLKLCMFWSISGTRLILVWLKNEFVPFFFFFGTRLYAVRVIKTKSIFFAIWRVMRFEQVFRKFLCIRVVGGSVDYPAQ